ncbi:MAG: penicillin-binding transpeptidase domain-containing protein [Candidatus Limivicinus sp.]|nr:penicillin-binding transpeptidase domain-containing protein [Candidatus Limivicinus sp.]
MNKLIKSGRVATIFILLMLLLSVYLVFLYKLQIIEGEEYYNQSNEIKTEERRVTASRGNILDRYGRVLVSNKECYNLTIDTAKLFASEDPNSTILELIEMVEQFGDTYTDDLPITTDPPFEYDPNMTDIQRTMLEAYFKDETRVKEFKAAGISEYPSAVELLSYMRTRYNIDNSYSAEEMRKIAGLRYSINVRYSINTADYVFVQDASMELITSIMENKLAGIEVTRAYAREYGTEYAAHLLGYVGLMTQEEYEKYSLRDYANDAMVGKDGVEYAFEDYLHGEDGTVEETRNASGTILSTVYTEEPVPGNHVYLTIDIVLQEQVERILDNGIRILTQERMTEKGEQEAKGLWTFEDGFWEITGGAAVVVNVKTGEPLAISSWPTYDVTTIIENYSDLLEAENAPLFNRALMGAYAPGSVFKPCTAIAALSEGIVNTEEEIKCEGVYTRYASEGYAPECWIWSSIPGEHYTHGELNVTGALLNSCNYFFYSVGNFLGIDNLEKYARGFGLGESTGIELVETKGNMSSEDTHMDYAGTEWRIGDTLQAAIGQSDSIFSPLQLAEYCAAVANSGTRHSASILKSVRNYDYSEEVFTRQSEVMSTVTSAQYNWDAVHDGMFEVANNWQNEAVAKYFIDLPQSQRAAAKTGTAQKGENIVNDAIFICYAPFDDPEVAVAIVVERGKAGANCAFMARQILDVYFNIKSYSDSSEGEMSLLK